MPGVGRSVVSLAEFIAEIQTTFYELIADLTTRVDALEENPAPASGQAATTTYVSTGSVTNTANLVQTELLNVSPSIGTSTIPGGTLDVGSTIVVNIRGTNLTGGSGVVLRLRLYGSPDGAIIEGNTLLAPAFSGAIAMTITMTIRETTVVTSAFIINGTSISSAFNEMPFNRAVDCPLTLTSSWDDTESGGVLTIESRTIEIKPPPAA